MHRFYIESKNISKGLLTVGDKKTIHYLVNVLRIKNGRDKVVFFDENRTEYLCELENIPPEGVIFKIIESYPGPKRDINITVACAIPKKSNMDDIVDKLTQLGIDTLIPLKTERMIVRLDRRKESLLTERWKRISLSASQQSRRNSLMIIEPVQEIKQAILDSGGRDLKLIPTLSGERKAIKEVLDKGKSKNIIFLIGPEGDFTDEEVVLALKNGFIPVDLGDNVLRVETAAVAVASFISLYLYEKN